MGSPPALPAHRTVRLHVTRVKLDCLLEFDHGLVAPTEVTGRSLKAGLKWAAKRRAAATLVSYLTPPIASAGLYRGLSDLKSSIERWRNLAPDASDEERKDLAVLIQAQAAEVDLAEAASETEAEWTADSEARITRLNDELLELEYTLIPHGMHVVGEPPSAEERTDLLLAVAEAKKLGIPVVGVVDTNNDPDVVDYVIPGNDDAIRAVQLYVQGASAAVLEGRASAAANVGGGGDFVEVEEAAG